MSYTRGFLYQSSSHKNFSLSYVPTFPSYPNVASPYQRPSLIRISPPHIFVSPPYQRLSLISTSPPDTHKEIPTDQRAVSARHGVPFSGSGSSALFFRDSGVQPAAPCFAVFRVFPTRPLHVSSRIDRGERPSVVV